ncbi:MAG: glycerol kinase GlpK [Alphaproteobacteria bacterium]|nr:glycerol kinase GlpK [Alphaproteobacteria bacterium]
MTTLLALDQGTTSTRAILFDTQGNVLGVSQKELKLHMPNKGWVEQNPENIWADTIAVIHDVMEKYPEHAAQIKAMGITNQRETTIVWDRHTGRALYNAIVWQDRRTADVCDALKKKTDEKIISEKTGLLLDPYFSATKIAWILDNVEGARAKAEKGGLAFGTVDSYLLWKLTDGKKHVTDATNASRTMLFNININKWDEELLGIFNIPASMLPEVYDCAADFGVTDKSLFNKEIPVCGVAGDQQAALIGQACFTPGMVKSTYGTGCFMVMNTGEKITRSQNRLLSTIGYRLNGKTTYALEGSIFVAGAAIQFLRDNLQFFVNAAESEALALSVSDNNGVYFVPALTGLGAPYWQADAQGMISGLTRESTKAHITRAALEAQAYQTHDLTSAMQKDTGQNLTTLRVDGGLVANRFVCQHIADILGIELQLPKVLETTAWGAACLAGLQKGVFKSLDDISCNWKEAKTYKPAMNDNMKRELLQGWQSAVKQDLTR